jgi:MFS family permease
MDMSSEIIHSLLPVYVVTVLGASALALGLIEGVAESIASFSKIVSGAISDHFAKRKPLVVCGYGLAAITKPLFPLAPSVEWIFTARTLDRVGKGIRGAPRDALIGDLSPAESRGSSYGLRQSLDTIGALLGPVLAIGLMALAADNIRAVLWAAVVPAAVAVLVLLLFVHEPPRPRPASRRPWPSLLPEGGLGVLGRPFWIVVAVAGLFGLARFSEAFLVLRAADAGLSTGLIPLVIVVMSAVYALAAYPAGIVADSWDRRWVLAAGLVALVAADLVLAAAASVTVVMFGIGLWGLHMGLTQGVFAAVVADVAPEPLRATAFGWFHLVSGVALLAASAVAGAGWDAFGPAFPFLVGAGAAVATLLALIAVPRQRAGTCGRP